VKNIAVLTVLVIISGVFSYAQESERNYGFSFGPQSGFIWGQAKEYVYSVPGETKNEFLSELVWDMKPVFYYGIHAEFGRLDKMKGPGFFSSLSFKTGIPIDSGIMEDRDWQSVENSALTNFSSHTNRTTEFFLLDAAVGVSFPIKTYLYLTPFISGSWARFAFTGRDGYGVYAREKDYKTYYSIDDNPQQVSYKGYEVIRYEQDWLLLSVGVSAGTKILYPFIFDLSFQISPLTYCAATDNHILRSTVFRDFTAWGLFLEPSFKASYVVKTVEFSLGLSYRHIGKTKGESYANENNAGFRLAANKAGAGLSMTDISLLVGIRL
jgi:outer membrane protease